MASFPNPPIVAEGAEPQTGEGLVYDEASGGWRLQSTGVAPTFSAPEVVSGTAFQPSATQASTLYVSVSYSVAETDHTATLELGPTATTTSNKVDTAVRLPAIIGLVYARTVEVPAGWYVKLTLSSTTDATIAASVQAD